MARKCRKVGVMNAFTYILFYYYFFFEIPCLLGLFQMTSMQCTICGLDEGGMSLVGEKGLETLFVAASKKKETELTQTLKDHQNRGTHEKPKFLFSSRQRLLPSNIVLVIENVLGEIEKTQLKLLT